MSFQQIAQIITALGAGDMTPDTAGIKLPEDVVFPPGYTISKQRVNKIVRLALTRYPMLQAKDPRS